MKIDGRFGRSQFPRWLPLAVLALPLAMMNAASAQDLQITGTLVFVSERDGNSELYTMAADGSGQTRLTNNSADDATPHWSPDGTKVAWKRGSGGSEDIYVMTANGADITRVTSTAGVDMIPRWSPDGSHFTFMSQRDGNEELYLMNADGTGVTRLTTTAGASEWTSHWSPDGTRIVFDSNRDGDWNVYVMNADGSGQTRLTTGNGDDLLPVWSPDGTRIAFNSTRDGNEEIYVMNADGSGQTRLTNNAASDSSPWWSPDGTRISFQSHRDGNWNVYVMNADGSGQTQLTTSTATDRSPVWSEFRQIGTASVGGSVSRSLTIENRGTRTLKITRIACSNEQFRPSATSLSVTAGARRSIPIRFTPAVGGVSYALLTMTTNDPDSPTIRLVINGTGIPTGIPDLELVGPLLFVSERDGNSELYTMAADGSDPARLTNSSEDDATPYWSPDGTKVAWKRGSGGSEDIYVMTANGAGITRVTNTAGVDMIPRWSPDGSHFTFMSQRDGNEELYLMNADGTGVTRLTTTTSASEWTSHWSPDGTRIVFDSNRDGDWNVYVMNADGSGQTRLTSGNGDDLLPVWSPDGTRIAFNSTRDGNEEIYVMNADGSGQTRLTNNAASDSSPWWSPDGTRIAFQSHRDGNWNVYVMNADGSGQTRLTTSTATDRSPVWSEFRQIGTTSVGGSVPRSLTIKNRGTATLTIRSIASNDQQFTVTPATMSIGAGRSQAVSVTFTPAEADVHHAVLSLTSDDPANPVVRLVVTGTASEPSRLDVNGDGVVDLDDCIEVALVIAGDQAPVDEDDVNGDGSVDAYDLLDILYSLAAAKPAPGAPILTAQVLPEEEGSVPGTIEVAVAASSPLSGYGFVVTYDTADWEFVEAAPSPEAEHLAVHASTRGGELALAGYGSPGSNNPVTGELARLRFRSRHEATVPWCGQVSGAIMLPNGTIRASGIALGLSVLPIATELRANYPNPFNPTTSVCYTLPTQAYVELTVFDVAGQRIRTLFAGQRAPGTWEATWEGLDDRGNPVASGVYLCVMRAGGTIHTRRMLLLR